MNTNVVFATDQNYISHLGVAIKSLLENNKYLDFNIFVINGGIPRVKWQLLEKIAGEYNCKLIDICIDDAMFNTLVLNHHFTKAAYYRLLIPNFIFESKVLYLDADIVVNASIEQLYNTDLEDFLLAGVINPNFYRHKELQMDSNSAYFNSGVMLINNKLWKDNNISQKVIDFVDKNQKVIEFVDQCGLNAIVNGRWKKLPLTCNQQSVIFENENLTEFSREEIEKAIKHPVIIHFTGSSKPWHFGNKHPYKYLYWRYLKMTPFKRYVPDNMTLINIIKWLIPKQIKQIVKGK